VNGLPFCVPSDLYVQCSVSELDGAPGDFRKTPKIRFVLLIKLPKIECHGQKGSRGFVHGVAEPGPAAERCDTCCDVHRARLSYTSGLTFFLSYSVLLGCFVLYTLRARSKV